MCDINEGRPRSAAPTVALSRSLDQLPGDVRYSCVTATFIFQASTQPVNVSSVSDCVVNTDSYLRCRRPLKSFIISLATIATDPTSTHANLCSQWKELC